MSITPILNMHQVAITLVYRYQPRPGVPIDAGEWGQVMENKGFIATIYSTSFGSCIWVSQMHHCATLCIIFHCAVRFRHPHGFKMLFYGIAWVHWTTLIGLCIASRGKWKRTSPTSTNSKLWYDTSSLLLCQSHFPSRLLTHQTVFHTRLRFLEPPLWSLLSTPQAARHSSPTLVSLLRILWRDRVDS